MKNDQTASKPREPRHIYANPFNPAVCPILALGMYLICFQGKEPSMHLFPGTNQYDRYSKSLQALLEANKRECERRGIVIGDIGTHSIRKGASTYCTSGTTSAPNLIAVQLRGGWTIEGVQSVYMKYDQAGDCHVGRTVTGLPMTEEFATLPPYFTDDANELVDSAIHVSFPFLPPELHRVAHFLLASLVYHADYLQDNLDSRHPVLRSALFADKLPLLRAKLVAPHLPKRGDRIQATGLPAHTLLSMQLANLHQDGLTVTSTIESLRHDLLQMREGIIEDYIKVLEDRAIQAQAVTPQGLSQRITEVIQPTTNAVARIEALLANLQRDQLTSTSRPEPEVASVRPNCHTVNVHSWGGKLHPVPETFRLPLGSALIAYQQWCCGDRTRGYPPIRSLSFEDLPTANERKRFSHYSCLMSLIDKECKRLDKWIADPTTDQATSMFMSAERVFDAIDETTTSNRKRRVSQLAWPTILNNLRVKRSKKSADQ